MFDLTGKVALVTGGARGMGRAEALALAVQGARVAVTDLSQADCERVVGEIEQAGGEACAYQMDVSDGNAVNWVFEVVEKDFGRLDILINNAGVYFSKPALQLTEEEWERTQHINLKGQFLCAQAAARLMAKHKWGRIINIASVASGQVGIGIAGGAHYTASKGGVVGLTETLAAEWAPLGITVNVIAPGAIDTPMVDAASLPKEVMVGIIKRIPLGRMGRAEEVAAAVVFLAAEESSYITGAMLAVDGGWLAA